MATHTRCGSKGENANQHMEKRAGGNRRCALKQAEARPSETELQYLSIEGLPRRTSGAAACTVSSLRSGHCGGLRSRSGLRWKRRSTWARGPGRRRHMSSRSGGTQARPVVSSRVQSSRAGRGASSLVALQSRPLPRLLSRQASRPPVPRPDGSSSRRPPEAQCTDAALQTPAVATRLSWRLRHKSSVYGWRPRRLGSARATRIR